MFKDVAEQCRAVLKKRLQKKKSRTLGAVVADEVRLERDVRAARNADGHVGHAQTGVRLAVDDREGRNGRLQSVVETGGLQVLLDELAHGLGAHDAS